MTVGGLGVVRVDACVILLVVGYQFSHDFHEVLSACLLGAIYVAVLREVCYLYQPHR